MTNNERITNVIFSAVEEVNDQLPRKQRLEKSIGTILFGKSGKLDSLALVNLIVAVEEKIQEEFGVTVTLADERAMSQTNSPFKSLGTFADYVTLLLEEQTHSQG